MARYIDADKLIYNEITDEHGDTYLVVHAPEIDNAPTEDVQPVVHGKWIKNDIPNSELSKCTNCGYDLGAWSFKYCPNCGAKMDEHCVRDILKTR